MCRLLASLWVWGYTWGTRGMWGGLGFAVACALLKDNLKTLLFLSLLHPQLTGGPGQQPQQQPGLPAQGFQEEGDQILHWAPVWEEGEGSFDPAEQRRGHGPGCVSSPSLPVTGSPRPRALGCSWGDREGQGHPCWFEGVGAMAASGKLELGVFSPLPLWPERGALSELGCGSDLLHCISFLMCSNLLPSPMDFAEPFGRSCFSTPKSSILRIVGLSDLSVSLPEGTVL